VKLSKKAQDAALAEKRDTQGHRLRKQGARHSKPQGDKHEEEIKKKKANEVEKDKKRKEKEKEAAAALKASGGQKVYTKGGRGAPNSGGNTQ
jgi:hypothetical protein